MGCLHDRYYELSICVQESISVHKHLQPFGRKLIAENLLASKAIKHEIWPSAIICGMRFDSTCPSLHMPLTPPPNVKHDFIQARNNISWKILTFGTNFCDKNFVMSVSSAFKEVFIGQKCNFKHAHHNIFHIGAKLITMKFIIWSTVVPVAFSHPNETKNTHLVVHLCVFASSNDLNFVEKLLDTLSGVDSTFGNSFCVFFSDNFRKMLLDTNRFQAGH